MDNIFGLIDTKCIIYFMWNTYFSLYWTCSLPDFIIQSRSIHLVGALLFVPINYIYNFPFSLCYLWSKWYKCGWFNHNLQRFFINHRIGPSVSIVIPKDMGKVGLYKGQKRPNSVHDTGDVLYSRWWYHTYNWIAVIVGTPQKCVLTIISCACIYCQSNENGYAKSIFSI